MPPVVGAGGCVFVEIISQPLTARRALCSGFIGSVFWRGIGKEGFRSFVGIQGMWYKFWNIQLKCCNFFFSHLQNECVSVSKTETQENVPSPLFLNWLDFEAALVSLPQSFLNCTYIRKKNIFCLSSEFWPPNPLFRQAALRQGVLFPMLTSTFELFVSHLLFVNTSCLVLLMLLAPWKTSSIFLCLHTASKQQEICPWLGSPRNARMGFSCWGSQLRKLVRGKQWCKL